MDPVDEIPDPGRCGSPDDLVGALRRLKIWAGDPSYEIIKDRVNAVDAAPGRPVTEPAGKSTVADCFRPGRRRFNVSLVLAVVWALHPDAAYGERWRQALRRILEGASAAPVGAELPEKSAQFRGRDDELGRIRAAALGGARTITISGMPGVGKTLLAVHAGRLLMHERGLDRILFVNLRGFDPEPDRPPTDPAAVLEAFLRLLGMPMPQIPRGLPARVAAFRERLAGSRALVVLDNAAETVQVAPLIADSDGSLTLVTSRRRLTGLPGATHVGLDVFTPQDAEGFLRHTVGAIATGSDAQALHRIAERCGCLPLALGVVAGHIRAQSGWTLSDHADRLDKRYSESRLDSAVELSLDVSYRHLPAAEQRLLRLLALHPGQDFDSYAAAALAGAELSLAQRHLRRLTGDNLLQALPRGRHTFHDLVRTYAVARAGDDEPSSRQREALTRLFDHYLATAADAAGTVHPNSTPRPPKIDSPGTPAPVLGDRDTALAWLNTERPTLVAVTRHTAVHGWPTYTTRLSEILRRYLSSGHFTDGLTVHGHAVRTAELTGDRAGQIRALVGVGATCTALARYTAAVDHYRQALDISRRISDPTAPTAVLHNLAIAEIILGHHHEALDHIEQKLAICRQTGSLDGEAAGLIILGEVETRLGRYGPAGTHLQRALTLYRQLGSAIGESWSLDSLGSLFTHLGQSDQAAEHHQQALDSFRSIGDREGQSSALIGLGAATSAAGRPADALTHHIAALAVAADIGDRHLQALAHTGLGDDHHTLGDHDRAAHHHRIAAALNSGLDSTDAGTMAAGGRRAG